MARPIRWDAASPENSVSGSATRRPKTANFPLSWDWHAVHAITGLPKAHAVSTATGSRINAPTGVTAPKISSTANTVQQLIT